MCRFIPGPVWGCDELAVKCVRKMWVGFAVPGLKPGWEQGCDHTRGDPEPFACPGVLPEHLQLKMSPWG